MISSLLLRSSNVQEEYFISTRDAKAPWNIWKVTDAPDLPHRVLSRPSTRWNYHYSHRANILPSRQRRIQRRISETDTTKASSWLKRSILGTIFWEEQEMISKQSTYFFTAHILKWTIYATIQLSLLYIFLSSFPTLWGLWGAAGEGSWRIGTSREPMAPNSRDVQLPARTVTSSALREVPSLCADNRTPLTPSNVVRKNDKILGNNEGEIF